MKHWKVLNSQSGFSRMLRESEFDVGQINRRVLGSPFHYAPETKVHFHYPTGRFWISAETSHRRYEVKQVDSCEIDEWR